MNMPRRRSAAGPTAAGPATLTPVPEAAGAHPAAPAAGLVVADARETRIRMPTDAMRFLTSCLEVAVMVALGLLARATATGVEVDVVGVSRHLPAGLVSPLHTIAFAALVILPVALAIRLIVISQPRRLIDAVVIGAIAGAIAVGCSALLRLAGLHPLQDVLVRAGSPIGASALDPLLTGLAAYLTVIGLSGRPRWRTWFWLAIGFYCLTSLALVHDTATVLSLLIALALGAAAGSGLRYLIGTTPERPSAAVIASALSMTLTPVVAIRRVPDIMSESRRYITESRDGEKLDVTVFDRDQQAADFLYRAYRRVRLTAQASRSSPLTVGRAVERQTLMSYALAQAGVASPRLRAALRVGPEAAAVATEHVDGATLAEMDCPPSDQVLSDVFDAVLALHRHRVTHRSLTPDRILVARDGRVLLLDPAGGDIAATDLQIRLDLAQLIASVAVVAGPERVMAQARRKLDPVTAAGLVPLLQPVVLLRETRSQLRKHKDVLPALRKGLMRGAPDPGPQAEQIERIRPRNVATLVALIVALYLVVGELGQENLVGALRHSDWRWVLAALALSAVTYVGAAWSLSGFVLEKLRFGRTLLAQLAATFVALVAPGAVGGVALNIRYLHKAKVAPADAASSVGVSQAIALVVHLVMLIIFAALTGNSPASEFRPPTWSYFALAAIAAVAAAVLAVPAGRRVVRSRLAPTLSQVIPRLLDIAQRPLKLAEGVGGAALVTFGYIVCLYFSVRAVGGHAPFAAVAVVFLTGQAIGSVVPTPGGLGALEVAMSTGLSSIAHLPLAVALSGVLVFRILTFWLPIPVGWLAFGFLQRRDAL